MEKPPPKVFKVKDPDPDDKFSDIQKIDNIIDITELLKKKKP